MKNSFWRTASFFLIALGILLGSSLVATNAFAATEPIKTVSTKLENGSGCYYVVRRGDTLFSIGMRYGVSPYYLAQINGLWNPNIIYAGMTLMVPCGGGYPYPPQPPKPPRPSCQCDVEYVVRPGDNLFRIALNHGTTVNLIRDFNDLWGKVLRPGSTIFVPCPHPERLPEKEAQPTTAAAAPEPTGEAGGVGTGPDPAAQPTAEMNTTPAAPEQQAVPPTAVPAPQNGKSGGYHHKKNPCGSAPPPNGEPKQPTAVPDRVAPTLTPPTDQAPAPEQTPGAEIPGLPPEPSASIVLGASAVDPATVTITAGQSVLFTNNSENVYTIVSGLPGQPLDVFNSGQLPAGATWLHTFDAAGSYSYHIAENPTLIGQVIVNNAP
jgi:LysM repeat protein